MMPVTSLDSTLLRPDLSASNLPPFSTTRLVVDGLMGLLSPFRSAAVSHPASLLAPWPSRAVIPRERDHGSI